jgi:Tfp pilus assembly protein FimT
MDRQHRYIRAPVIEYGGLEPLFAPQRTAAAGFTYVEMIAIMLILLLMASLIVPSIMAHQRSTAQKELEGQVARLPQDARNEAVQLQNPVSIRISGNSLIMEEQIYAQTTSDNSATSTTLSNVDPNAGASGSTNNGAGSSQVQLKEIDLDSAMQIAGTQLNGQSTDAGSWLWIVYPDGSAEQGGIQFAEGTSQKSLIMNSNGESQWISGELPDVTENQWPAGQLATPSSPPSSTTP